MSFLGHHFYIDAGIILPEKIDCGSNNEDFIPIEDKMKSLELNIPREGQSDSGRVHDEMRISTVSVENTNIENMSDDDLKELETSTTNITDDVKVNIQKKSLSNVTPRSKAPSDPVKKRNKRYSSVFPLDQQTTSNIILKRRSLNIGPSELSKIPISFKYAKKAEEKTNLRRSKSGSIQSCYSGSMKGNGLDKKGNTPRVKLPLNTESGAAGFTFEVMEKVVGNGNVAINTDERCKVDNTGTTNAIKVKENVPTMSDGILRINVPNRCVRDNVAKVSNLPVLVR